MGKNHNGMPNVALSSPGNDKVSSSICFLLFLLLLCIIKMHFNAKSEDPDQMLHSMASDLDLHCLTITLLGCSPLKCVNIWTY